MGVECSGRLALEREDKTLVDTRAVRAGAKAAAEVRKDVTVKRASFILQSFLLEIMDINCDLRSSMDFVSMWSSNLLMTHLIGRKRQANTPKLREEDWITDRLLSIMFSTQYRGTSSTIDRGFCLMGAEQPQYQRFLSEVSM